MAKAYDNARQELTELARIKNDFMAKIELAGRDSGARRSSRARRAPPPPPPPCTPTPSMCFLGAELVSGEEGGVSGE